MSAFKPPPFFPSQLDTMSEMMWADGVVLMWGGRADHMDLDKLMDVDDLEQHEGDDFALPQVRPLVRPSAINAVA